jgi:hypothetical protein
MDSGEDLIQNVYAYFLKAYQQGEAGAAQNELVAFESIGFSPGCSALTGNNVAAAALEAVSHFCDELPEVAGGVYTHTLRTISGTYGNMIDAAESSSAAALVTFADLKSQAKKAYQGDAIGSFDGPTSYLPVYPTPIDWYDLNNAANWQSYSYDASVKAPTSATSAPAPVAPNVRMQWRIVPQNIRSVILVKSGNQGSPAAQNPSTHPLFMRAMMVPNQPVGTKAWGPAQTFAKGNVGSPAAASAPISHVPMINAFRLTGLASVTTLATQTQSQPVETPKFTMSFDYCLVRLRRQWFSGDLLATLGWYIPGAHAGDYASGPPANTGPFAFIPTAFIAVKNLVIDAAWSDSDVAARANAASFGPFSLLGSPTDDKNSVRNPGIQIIAWICSAQSQLPPDTDPSLVPVVATQSANTPPSSDSGSGTQATDGSSAPTASSGGAGDTAGTGPASTSTGTSGASSTSTSGSVSTPASSAPSNASSASPSGTPSSSPVDTSSTVPADAGSASGEKQT